MTEWYPKLPQGAALSPDRTLWVPMLMEALVCGEDDVKPESFVDLTPRYDRLQPDALLGHMLKPALDAGQGMVDEFVKPGIHLHWTLPAAFRHVRASTDQNKRMLLAPNRWFVIRIWESSTYELSDPNYGLSQKSWVVESDYRHEDRSGEDGAPWLDLGPGGRSYTPTRLGRVMSPGEPTEPGTSAMTPLTAIAPANPAFAAYYPSCRSVFGLYDDAEGLKEGTLCTYLVAGWFSRDEDDPLYGVKKADDWIVRMRECSWEVSDETASLPTRIVCYATIRDVKWTKKKAPGDRPVDSEVALGNGLFEALAAMSKGQSANIPLLQDLQDRLQFAALRDRHPSKSDIFDEESVRVLFAEMDKFPSLKSRLHERAFSALPGGTAWEIARKERAEPPPDRNAELAVDLPDGIATDLYQINLCQRRHDELQRKLAGAQRDLYCAWYQLKYWRSTSGWDYADNKELVDALQGRIREAHGLLSGLDRIQAQLVSCQSELNGIKTRIEDALKEPKHKQFKDYELRERAMPRFWRPNDPFVLLTKVPVREVQGGRSPLMCRVSDQTILRLSQAVTGLDYSVIQIEREHLGHLAASLLPGGERVPANIRANVAELLLDLLFSHRVASGLLAKIFIGRRYGNPTEAQYVSAQTAIKEAQQKIEEAAEEAWKGNFGASELAVSCNSSELPLWSFLSALNVASTEHSPVFQPVFMLWNIEWHPYFRREESSSSLEQQNISAAWDLESGRCDFVWNEKAKLPELHTESDAAKYEGFTIVARRLERGLRRLELGLETTEKTFGRYEPIFEKLKNLAGQSLAGLTEALGMLDSGPQLPPPAEDDTDTLPPSARLKDAIDDGYGIAPLTAHLDDLKSSFFPIRGGHLRLTRLWLVDTFGRIRRIIENHDQQHLRQTDVHFSYALKSSNPQLAHFPPRLVQPSRLLFRWVSANDTGKESVADRQTSPICGWITYNRFDRSVLVYRADGLVLGAVSGGDSDREAHWSTLPQRPGQAEREPASIENIHLLGFVNGLRRPYALTALRDLLNRIEHRSEPSPEQGLQSIIGGWPLALVRASLRLTTDGPPITDQSKSQLSLPGRARGDRPSFMNVAFPVRIGDRRFGLDGLVGYFVCEDDAPEYTKMRVSAEQRPATAAEQHCLEFDSAVDVTCTGPDDPSLGLTLLMDPRFGVHIVSGILPVNLAVLPPSLVSATMAGLQLHFLVAPVFGEWDGKAKVQAPPAMPLPTGGQNEWAWTSIDAHGNARKVPLTADAGGAGSALFAARALYEGWLRTPGGTDEAHDR
jgi:hypothetical protein